MVQIARIFWSHFSKEFTAKLLLLVPSLLVFVLPTAPTFDDSNILSRSQATRFIQKTWVRTPRSPTHIYNKKTVGPPPPPPPPTNLALVQSSSLLFQRKNSGNRPTSKKSIASGSLPYIVVSIKCQND